MQDRRGGDRHTITFPIRVEWKDKNGKQIMEEGLTENVGTRGTLIYLPRLLPRVGSKVALTITENADDEVSVPAEVLRVERNAAHPQVALQITNQFRLWKEKVWKYAGEILKKEMPEEFDDW